MTADELKARIAAALPRDLVIDLMDAAPARALQAFELVRDQTDLCGRKARWMEGFNRYLLMEKGFQDVCELHGGVSLEGDLFPGTDRHCYQPFMRFGPAGSGVILGLASMPEKSCLPTKNRSRSAGVSLNRPSTLRMDLDGDGRVPALGDIFVLLLFARDSSQGGCLEEIAIGVVGADYQDFLVYETAEDFLALYAPSVETVEAPPEIRPAIALRKDPKAFRPPEYPDPDKAATSRDD